MVRRSAPSAGDGQTNTSHSDSDPSISRQLTPLSSADASQSAGSYGPPTDEDDPDVPLPSVETEPGQPSSLNTRDNSSLRSRTPSFSFTPSASSNESNRPTTERESTYSLRSRINSPNEIPTTRSPTVSGIANGMKNMAFGPEPSQSTPPPSIPRLHPESPNPNRTSPGATGRPRSRSRRRSGSHVDQSPHNVADELPPRERFHEPAFQQSFSNAKHLMVNLADILASSSLHSEPDSTMRRLYQQASDLSPVILLDWRQFGVAWLDLDCRGGRSTGLINGVEWILKLWSSWSASSIPNQKEEAEEEGSIRSQSVV